MILRKLHVYLYVFSVGFSYLLLFPFFYYYSRKPSRYPQMAALRRVWGYVSSLLVGIRYKFELEQPIDWSKTYIVCPNHTSNLDITALSILVKSNCSFMGKQELADFFVTALFFRTMDIPVDRQSKIASFRAFKKLMERIQNGVTAIIFPEATIPDHYPPQIKDFKNGPFRMAIELKVPIIPITSLNTWEILWDDGLKYGSKPGVCNIFVHKPVETAHLTIDDADALRDEVHAIISKKLEQHDYRRTNS